jgi:hypothetical protein
MKKHIKRLDTIFLFLILAVFSLALPVFSFANGDEVVKKKTINRSYPVTAADKLDIVNSFGNIVISTWDKKEFSVEIEIGAYASTEEKAQQMLDKISISEEHSGSVFSFKTKADNINNGGPRHKNKDGDGEEDKDNRHNWRFYINYTVHMPSTNPLQLENSFGKTTVPDFNGEIALTSKFGSLTAGKLSNVKAITVEFGSVSIDEVQNGKIVLKFNKESRIANVNGNVKITSEFSHNVQFTIGNEIEELSVFESYSGVRLVVTKGLSAEFNIHTSFGSFHNDSEFSIKEDKDDGNEYGPHFDKDYTGKAGDGKAKIKIKSSFGNVRLSHTNLNSNEDKNKGKDKN